MVPRPGFELTSTQPPSRVDRRDRMSQTEPLVFRIFLGREEWVENTRQGIGFDTDAGIGNDDNPVCRFVQRLAETDQGIACDFVAGDLFNGYGKDSAELLVAAFFFSSPSWRRTHCP